MFRNLLSRLFDDEDPRPLVARDSEVAIAALMVRLARADDHYGAAEKARIDQIIGARSGLGSTEAAERRAAAEMIEAEAPDTVRFTRSIKSHVTLEDRASVIEALWAVAAADERRAPDEDAFIRMVAGLLGVGDVASGLARQRAGLG